MRFQTMLFVLLFLINSCDLANVKEPETETVNEQGDLLSETYAGEYSKGLISAIASSQGFTDVLPFIKYSVEVYNITYSIIKTFLQPIIRI